MEYDRVPKMGSTRKHKPKPKPQAVPYSPYHIKNFDFTGATLGEDIQNLLTAYEPFARRDGIRSDTEPVRIRKSLTAFVKVLISLGEFRTMNHYFEGVAEVMKWPKDSCIDIAKHLLQGRKQHQRRGHRNQHYGTSLWDRYERALAELVDRYQGLSAEEPAAPLIPPGKRAQDVMEPRLRALRQLIAKTPEKLVLSSSEIPLLEASLETTASAEQRKRSMSPATTEPLYRSRSPLHKPPPSITSSSSSDMFVSQDESENELQNEFKEGWQEKEEMESQKKMQSNRQPQPQVTLQFEPKERSKETRQHDMHDGFEDDSHDEWQGKKGTKVQEKAHDKRQQGSHRGSQDCVQFGGQEETESSQVSDEEGKAVIGSIVDTMLTYHSTQAYFPGYHRDRGYYERLRGSH